MRVSQMNWGQVEAYLQRDDRAVLPLGSTEQHAGLSLAVDSILADKVAVDAAEPLGIPVFPTVHYGLTPYFLAYPGTVSLRVETYARLIRDVLDSLAGSGFRRILIVNGHGGNQPAHPVAIEWMADHPDVRIRFHNWWNAPRTITKVQEIDPIASHASWMENFPWTRLPGVEVPSERKPMIDLARMRLLAPKALRDYLGDGNFGGLYQRPDEDMAAIWRVAVEETRALLEGPWGMSAPIVVWGAGAIGGAIGAALVQAGHEVLFVDRARDHVAAMNRSGLTITGPVHAHTVPARATTPEGVDGVFDTVILCVKAQDTLAATRALAPHLAPKGQVVSAQNGLNERVIAGIVGEARTIGCFVNFGADYHGPGEVMYGGRGAVVVGELDGRRTARIERIHGLFRQFDADAVLTDNIWGYLWSKLIYGTLLFATALTDDSIADVLDSRRHRPMLAALGREVAAVAAAEQVRLESFNGFDPSAFTAGASSAALERSFDDMVAFNRRSAKTHSGIWRDLAVRKRQTEVDQQIAPIVEIGQSHGLAAPLTARLVELIHDLEGGRRGQAWATLDALGAAPLPAAG